MNDWEMDEEAAQRRAERRAKHRQEMLRSKRRQMLFRKLFKLFLPFILGAAVIGLLIFAGTKIFEKAQGTDESNQTISAENLTLSDSVSSASLSDNTVSENEAEEQTALIPTATANEQTLSLGADIVSEHAILVDESQNLILAQKDAQTKIWPASMTKVLTVLVAAEHVTDLDDTFTMTLDITDYSYVNDCSNVGFLEHETVTVRDLFYGTILKSGADAAVGLATYVAGSHEAFVDMMNEKLDELGMSDTAHFTNCVGIYDEDHYCTIYDMAMIMEAAMQNDLCREVLSAHTYTTSSTTQNPDGITISNWFLRRIEDKDAGALVLGGKTGYVVQSGNCAVSYAITDAGDGYICATSNSVSGWRCIYDHVDIYHKFLSDTPHEDHDRPENDESMETEEVSEEMME